MTDPAALVAELAVEVLLLDVPDPCDPKPGATSGDYWLVGDLRIHDNAEPLDVAACFMRDRWRRGAAGRLVRERCLPAELVALVWEALPYESVQMRFGWEEWRRRREAAADRARAA